MERNTVIPLTRGLVALVSPEDHEELSKHNWLATPLGKSMYAARRDKKTRKLVFMHRVVAATPPGMDTDHANGNTLDNRRTNLRHATKAQNAANQGKRTGRFKGVSKTRNGKWQAQCSYQGRSVALGNYASEEQAAVAYDLFAHMAHGEFAQLNGV